MVCGSKYFVVDTLNSTKRVRFAIWFAIGLGVYFGYSRKHSKLAAPQR